MKILTKEEEEAHYNETLKGGALGGAGGFLIGGAALLLANRRYAIIRHLTVPMKAFLVTSSTTFAAITVADSFSRSFEASRRPEERFEDSAAKQRESLTAQQPLGQRLMTFGREHRYQIVGASWAASMGIALGLVGRNPYLRGAQKLVQARMYAQGLTVLVLIATAAFEISDVSGEKGRWETVKVLDPGDPTHKRLIEKRVHHEEYKGEDQWKDMIAAEEQRMKDRQHEIDEREAKHHNKNHKDGHGHDNHDSHNKNHKKHPKKEHKQDGVGGEPRPSELP